MAARVWVRSVEVEQEQICLHELAKGPDCDQHDHVPGARRLRVELEPVLGSATEDEWRALIGQPLDVVHQRPRICNNADQHLPGCDCGNRR